MSLAFLPEIAAAGVALVAARAGDRLRLPSLRRKRCADAERKAVVWSYNRSRNNANSDAWRPVVRKGDC
jgi:hypothetical protein